MDGQMVTIPREVAENALEALRDYARRQGWRSLAEDELQQALREARAASEQVPVAWYRPGSVFVSHLEPPDEDEVVIGEQRFKGLRWRPLYAAPYTPLHHDGPGGVVHADPIADESEGGTED